MSAGERNAVYGARVHVNWCWLGSARDGPSVCPSFVLLGSVFRVRHSARSSPALARSWAALGAIARRSGAIIRRSGAIACGSKGLLSGLTHPPTRPSRLAPRAGRRAPRPSARVIPQVMSRDTRFAGGHERAPLGDASRAHDAHWPRREPADQIRRRIPDRWAGLILVGGRLVGGLTRSGRGLTRSGRCLTRSGRCLRPSGRGQTGATRPGLSMLPQLLLEAATCPARGSAPFGLSSASLQETTFRANRGSKWNRADLVNIRTRTPRLLRHDFDARRPTVTHARAGSTARDSAFCAGFSTGGMLLRAIL